MLLYILLTIMLIALIAAAYSTVSCIRLMKSLDDEKKSNARMANRIEEQDRIIKELSELHNSILEASRQKTEFFCNIVHELKTPLSVILGAIQLILQRNRLYPADNNSVLKHLNIIRQNCYRLLRLVGNILDITRFSSGYKALNAVNCNIVRVISEIIQSVIPYAEQRGIFLELNEREKEIITAVDIDKMERIVLNLVSNAIKFTPKGGRIWVNVRRENNRVFFSVKDTGPGIPQENQKDVFERFRKANSSLTREAEGSGIGLSLVKSFVELHNGNIRLISEEGKGSEFIVDIPIRICDSTEEYRVLEKIGDERITEAINIELSDIYTVT